MVNQKPLISVIITTYNRAHLLPRAINSVLNQTYDNFELIIIDDGSSDNTETIVKSYNDNRIIYHKHDKNKGVLAAKNTGLNLAEGEYHCMLDSDDELVPEALNTAIFKLMELSNKGIKVIWFNCINAENRKISGSGFNNERYIYYEDLLSNKIHGEFWLFSHKDWISNNRFDENLLGEESILWRKLIHKSPGYFIPKILRIYYRQHGDRISTKYYLLNNIAKITLTQKTFIKDFGKDMRSINPVYYSNRLGYLGTLEILNGETILGRKTLQESFKYIFSFKFKIIYLLSFILKKKQIKFLFLIYFKFMQLFSGNYE